MSKMMSLIAGIVLVIALLLWQALCKGFVLFSFDNNSTFLENEHTKAKSLKKLQSSHLNRQYLLENYC